MSYTVRTATTTDIAELYALEEACFIESKISKRSFRYLINKAKATTLVIINNSIICGYVIALYRNKSKFARIYSLAILPQYRKQGYGKILLQQAEEKIIKHGYKEITLEVRKDNHSAIQLYTKYGYTVWRKIDHYYEDGMSAIKMVKQIT